MFTKIASFWRLLESRPFQGFFDTPGRKAWEDFFFGNFGPSWDSCNQKNPGAHKNKFGTFASPLPKETPTPPPPRPFLKTSQEIQRAHKIGFSAPELWAETLRTSGFFWCTIESLNILDYLQLELSCLQLSCLAYSPCYSNKNGRFISSLLLLGKKDFICLEKGKFVFQKSLSEPPLKPDQISFFLHSQTSVFSLITVPASLPGGVLKEGGWNQGAAHFHTGNHENHKIARLSVDVCGFWEGLSERGLRRGFPLWSWRPPNSTETQKELKWPKSDSKVTPGVPSQSDPKWLKSDSKMTQNWVRSHFWVTLGSLWGRSGRVTFESLLGHFNSFCVSVELGGRRLRKVSRRCVGRPLGEYDP